MHTFHVYLYDPDTEARPRMQALQIEVAADDRMRLDALMRLKALDPSLSFRRSCHAALGLPAHDGARACLRAGRGRRHDGRTGGELMPTRKPMG